MFVALLVKISPGLSNAAAFRNSEEGETMIISACFEEEVTYMFCSIRMYRGLKPVYFSFSTTTPVCTLPHILLSSSPSLFSFLFSLLSFLLSFLLSPLFKIVRKEMTEIPDASLAYMDGYQHAWSISFGEPKYVCRLILYFFFYFYFFYFFF